MEQWFPDHGPVIPQSLNTRSSATCMPYVYFTYATLLLVGFPGGSVVKNLPPNQETQRYGFDLWVQSLSQGGLLEQKMAIHSSILVWKIPWIEEPDGLQFMGLQRVGYD